MQKREKSFKKNKTLFSLQTGAGLPFLAAFSGALKSGFLRDGKNIFLPYIFRILVKYI